MRLLFGTKQAAYLGYGGLSHKKCLNGVQAFSVKHEVNYASRMFAACLPFGPSTMSKLTRCSSFKVL